MRSITTRLAQKNRTAKVYGYTIVEVMIFLAVSGMILLSALALMSGQQGKTQFNQSMRDFNTKLQSLVGDVKTGFYPSDETSSCSYNTATSRPQLATVPSGGTKSLGSNEACIYLGKTIQLVQNTGQVYAYTVLGNRTVNSGTTVTKTLASQFDNANPEPAYFTSGPDLTEAYSIPANATIKSSKVTTPNDLVIDSTLVGFYSSLQGSSTTSGSQSLLTKGYSYTANGVKDNNVKTCIRQTQPATCANQVIKKWEICIQSGTSDQHALITLSSTVAGISSDLEIKDC